METFAEYWSYARWALVGFAVIYVVLEVVLNVNNQSNDTSNLILLEWSQTVAPGIPFALGAIGGHLFLGTTDPAFKLDWAIPVIVLVVIFAAFSLLRRFIPWKEKRWFHSLLLGLGVTYGHFIWSQYL